MYDNYNYEDSVRTIKSALFDIYEHQEIVIGSIENDIEREKHVNKYIDVKNSALELVRKIEELYNKKNQITSQSFKKNIDKSEELKIDEEEPESVEQESEETSDLIDEDDEEEPESVEQEAEETSDLIDEDNDNRLLKKIDEGFESIEEDPIESLEKYYLDDRNGSKPNFAYVPINLYEKIKNYKNEDENKLYKQDDIEKKGIIVRNDQYMKLSLSKHRQEGVLKEAKAYRIDQARKSRIKLENV